MSINLNAALGLQQPNELDAFIKLFDLFVNDRAGYSSSVHGIDAYLDDNTKDLLSRGMFVRGGMLEEAILLQPACSKGINMLFYKAILNNCEAVGLISYSIPGQSEAIMLIEPRIKLMIELDILRNCLVGDIAHTANSYLDAILAIDVLKSGEQYRGTGFIYSRISSEEKFIVTAKHNVDKDDGVIVKSISSALNGGSEVAVGSWRLHPELDLAIAPTKFSPPRSFRSVGRADVLETVVSLGYPRIPTAFTDHVLAHRGEVNAINVESMLCKGRHIVISNLVGPGSSGGPVFSTYGILLGVVTKSFEGNQVLAKPGLQSLHLPHVAMQAALNASEIEQFLIDA